ncbi:ABC transporter permease [Lactobacillus rizhaonensis]|uniref:ABC transporter permease n=1 Tax=Lactobacillus rizhaonensis TaxID=3082863 RepID=UPI0030C6EA3C
MIYSIKQELYKLVHRKISWIAALILFFLMLITGFALADESKKLILTLTFDSSDFIMFILVIVGATCFSMEFQNNTILTLLYKSSNKVYVYLSKYIVLFIYDVFLHLLALFYTICLRYTLFNYQVNWSELYLYHQPVWLNMLTALLIDLVTTMLIIAIVFLLSCLINSNAVVITASLLVTLMGQSISSDLMNGKKLVGIMKWNPFNMVDLTRQYANYSMYALTTQLNNQELLVGSLVYIFIFVIAGYLIFRRKRF